MRTRFGLTLAVALSTMQLGVTTWPGTATAAPAAPAAPAPLAPRPVSGAPTAEPPLAIAPFGPAALPADLRTHLEEAASTGLLATGARVMPRESRLDPAGSACADDACLKRLAKTTGAPLWVRGTCAVEGTTYRLHLELFDAAEGAVVAARDDNCEICTEAEVAEMTNVAASALRATWKRSAKAATPPLPSAEQPNGVPSPAGSGPETNTGTRISVTTTGVGDAGAEGGRPTAFRRTLPYLLLGGAVLAVGAGVTFAYQNGRGTDFVQVGDMRVARSVYDTKTLALVSFGVGGLLVGAAVALFALADPASGTATASASTSAWAGGPGGLSIAF